MPSTLGGTELAFNHYFSTWAFIKQQTFPIPVCNSRVSLFISVLDLEFSPWSLNIVMIWKHQPENSFRKRKKEGNSKEKPTSSHSERAAQQRTGWKEEIPEQPSYLGFTALARRSSDKLQNLKLLIKCQINRLAWGKADEWTVCAPVQFSVIDGLWISRTNPGWLWKKWLQPAKFK